MKLKNADIVICGGGLSGIICSLALSKLGISIYCIDKQVSSVSKKITDMRSTAYLIPSKQFLETVEIWNHLSKNANPLKTLSIINSENGFPYNNVLSETKFESKEIYKDQFGWNINNHETKKILLNLISKNKLITFYKNDEITNIEKNNDYLTIFLKNNQKINTKLLIGADGRNSFIRKIYNISVKLTNLEQKAITFIIKHKNIHKDISYEIYYNGGPFTTIPLKSKDNNLSAVVWVDQINNIEKLLALSKKEFSNEVNKRSSNKLGAINVVSNLQSFPVSSQLAEKLVDHRMILIGEAAHALPPIGAQGLNLTIKDIKEIYDLIKNNPNSVGDHSMISKFKNKRFIDIKIRSMSVNFLNKISKSDLSMISNTRNFGLNFLQNIKIIKFLLMRFGLG